MLRTCLSHMSTTHMNPPLLYNNNLYINKTNVIIGLKKNNKTPFIRFLKHYCVSILFRNIFCVSSQDLFHFIENWKILQRLLEHLGIFWKALHFFISIYNILKILILKHILMDNYFVVHNTIFLPLKYNYWSVMLLQDSCFSVLFVAYFNL